MSQTARQTGLLFSANFFDAVTAFFLTILLARFLLPEKFGLYSAFNNFILLIAGVLDLGIGAALVRYLPTTQSMGLRRLYIRSGGFFIFTIAAVAAVLIMIFSFPISTYLFSSNLTPAQISWASVGSLLLIAYSYFSQVLQAKQQFPLAAICNFTLSLSRLLSMVLLYLTGHLSLSNAIIASALGPVIAVVLMLLVSYKNAELGQPEAGLYKKLLRFGRWIAVVNLNAAASSRLDSLLLLNLSNAHTTGIYFAAAKPVAFLPLLTNSFGKVISPKFALRNTRSEIINFTLKTYLGVAVLIFCSLSLMAVSPIFVRLLYGPGYGETISVIRLLLLSVIPYLLAFPLTNVLIYSLKQPHLMTIITTIQTIIIVCGGFLLIPTLHSTGLIISIALSNTWLLCSTLFFVLRRL